MSQHVEEKVKSLIDFLLSHNIAFFPLVSLTKKPAVTWDRFAKGEYNREELQQFAKEILEKHVNYAIPSQSFSHDNKTWHLLILDIENFDDFAKLYRQEEINTLCERTLCVKSVHNGLHVYLFTSQDIPPQKYNPFIMQNDRNVADLQSGISYVVAPFSCVDHSLEDKCKTNTQGVTCYEIYGNWDYQLRDSNVKDFLKDLVKRAKSHGFVTNQKFLEWLGEGKEEIEIRKEELIKLIEEARRYNIYGNRSIESIRKTLCEKVNDRLFHQIICEGKSYGELKISDRSRVDWNLARLLMLYGVTDIDQIKKLLPKDSKFNTKDKWKDYDAYTFVKLYKKYRKVIRARAREDRNPNILISAIAERIAKENRLYYIIFDYGGQRSDWGIFRFSRDRGVFEKVTDTELLKIVYRYLKPFDDIFKIKSFTRKSTIANEIIKEIMTRAVTVTSSNRIAFKNGTLIFNSSHVDFIRREDRTIRDYAFNYIPHEIDVDIVLKYKGKEISMQDIEEIAKQIAPRVLQLMKQWLNDKWILGFEAIGYCLIPDYRLSKVFVLYGEGGNGKSTFLTLLTRVLGEFNVSSVTLEDLAQDRFVIPELFLKLANVTSEPPEKLLSSSKFKMLTGGDLITARELYRKPFKFRNYAKLFIATNNLFEIKKEDDNPAFWRRIILMLFPNRFNSGSDPIAEVNEEKGVITVGLLSIIRVLQQGGFDYELDENMIRDIWLSESDSVYLFIKNSIEKEQTLMWNPTGVVEKTLLYNVYKTWCQANKHIPVEYNVFFRKLKEFFREKLLDRRIGTTEKRTYVIVGIDFTEKGKKIYSTEINELIDTDSTRIDYRDDINNI